MEKYNSKILLFGEYSLLYDSMALTMPYENYSGTWSVAKDKQHPLVQYSNNCLMKLAYFLADHIDYNFEIKSQEFLKDLENGLYYESNIPQGYGLGSSGSVVAAVFSRYVKVRNNLNDVLNNLSADKMDKLRNSLGKVESFFHGSSSGIDPLSILLNKPLLYKSKDDIQLTSLPTYNENGKNIIFLLNTLQERNTNELVGKFKSLCETPAYKKKLDEVLIPETNACINRFLENNSEAFYQHVNNLIEFQFDNMNFLIPENFQDLVNKGIQNGDYFLKICGAGGGGFILGFTKDWDKTKEALKDYQCEQIYRY